MNGSGALHLINHTEIELPESLYREKLRSRFSQVYLSVFNRVLCDRQPLGDRMKTKKKKDERVLVEIYYIDTVRLYLSHSRGRFLQKRKS